MSFARLALSCAVCCTFPVAALAMNVYMEQGIAQYNTGHYREAVKLFGQAGNSEFNNPLLHYYLANALNNLKQPKDAIKEYEIALTLKPEGQMADFCRQALIDLKAKPVFSLPPETPKVTAIPHVTPASTENLPGRFAEEEKNILAEAEARIASDQKRLAAEILRIEELRDQDTTNISVSRFNSNPMAAMDRRTQIKEEAERKIASLKSDFDNRKKETRDGAQTKIDALRNTAGHK